MTYFVHVNKPMVCNKLKIIENPFVEPTRKLKFKVKILMTSLTKITLVRTGRIEGHNERFPMYHLINQLFKHSWFHNRMPEIIHFFEEIMTKSTFRLCNSDSYRTFQKNLETNPSSENRSITRPHQNKNTPKIEKF